MLKSVLWKCVRNSRAESTAYGENNLKYKAQTTGYRVDL